MLLRPRFQPGNSDPLRIGSDNYNLNRMKKVDLISLYRRLAAVYRLVPIYDGYTKPQIIGLMLGHPTLKQMFQG